MKYLVVLIIVTLAAVGVYHQWDDVRSAFVREVPLVNEAPPSYFIVEDIQGHQHELGELRGKVGVIVVWSQSCDHCDTYMEKMQQFSDQYAAQGAMFVSVNNMSGSTDSTAIDMKATPASVADFARERGIRMPILVPNQSFQPWTRGGSVPQVLVLDRSTRIRYSSVAGYSGEVRAAVEQVLKQPQPQAQ